LNPLLPHHPACGSAPGGSNSSPVSRRPFRAVGITNGNPLLFHVRQALLCEPIVVHRPADEFILAHPPVAFPAATRHLHFVAADPQREQALEFEVEYGSYPSSLTIPQVLAKTGTTLTLGDDSSNELFKQFFAAKVAGSEQPFFAPGPGLRNPDNHFGSDATTLAKGECNFAYISGLEPAGNPRRAIVFGPIAPGTRSLDRKLFDGMAVLLHLDGSASANPIDRSGKIMIDGMDMLDPKHPIWDGKPFTVKWPK